jgi:hypothetical protein
MKLTLLLQTDELAVCRLPAGSPAPALVEEASFFAVTRTKDELSIVLPQRLADSAWRVERGWRALKVGGPLAFDVVGVVAALSGPLAGAGIPIFVISTFDTDYLLVKSENLDQALDVLRDAGHAVRA